MKKRPVVPAEYANKWIYWSKDGTEILWSADTMEELFEIVKENKYKDGSYEYIWPARRMM